MAGSKAIIHALESQRDDISREIRQLKLQAKAKKGLPDLDIEIAELNAMLESQEYGAEFNSRLAALRQKILESIGSNRAGFALKYLLEEL